MKEARHQKSLSQFDFKHLQPIQHLQAAPPEHQFTKGSQAGIEDGKVLTHAGIVEDANRLHNAGFTTATLRWRILTLSSNRNLPR